MERKTYCIFLQLTTTIHEKGTATTERTTPQQEYTMCIKNSANALRILVVSSDLPSHMYATAKLGKMLAASGHEVTLATPEGTTFENMQKEVRDTIIKVISVGPVTTKTFANVRPVVDSTSWSALFNALKNGCAIPNHFMKHFDTQLGMFEPLKKIVGDYNVVIPIHSVSLTVCDAVEASNAAVPCVIFSSLPYDPLTYLDERQARHMPRSLTAIPHVAAYKDNPPLVSFMDIIRFGIRLFWMALDAFMMRRAWLKTVAHHNARRAARGLEPMKDPTWRGYNRKYPTICMGGIKPFCIENQQIASNVTPIGVLDTPNDSITEISGDLKNWLDNTNDADIVYACFGTGTTLSEKEIAAVAGQLPRSLARFQKDHPPLASRVLLALRKTEQERLRKAIDASVGSGPTRQGDGFLEYMDGALRIQDRVPQVALLKSGRVRVFINHFGFGNFTEGVSAGIPMVAYPSGLDQYYNAQRAVEAGTALQCQHGMPDLDSKVMRALSDESMAERASKVSQMVSDYDGEAQMIRVIEEMGACNHVLNQDNQSEDFESESLNDVPESKSREAAPEIFTMKSGHSFIESTRVRRFHFSLRRSSAPDSLSRRTGIYSYKY